MPDEQNIFFPPRRNEIVTVLLAGLIITAIAIALAWATGTYLIAQVICRQGTDGLCGDPFTLSYNIYLILGALAATGWFAYSRVFRPALVALPAVVMFWSLPIIFNNFLAVHGLLAFAVVSTILITFSYLVFYWIVRVRNFIAVFVLWLVLTLGMRFLLVL